MTDAAGSGGSIQMTLIWARAGGGRKGSRKLYVNIPRLSPMDFFCLFYCQGVKDDGIVEL